MAHPYSTNTTTTVVAAATPDLRGLLAAASNHLGAALSALALHDVTVATDNTDSQLNFCEASLARLSLAEQQTAMELDTTTMDLDLAATVPRPRLHHGESPKDRVARRKLLLTNLHTPAKPKKPTTSSSPATDPSAVLLIDRTLAPARNVRARGF